MRLMLLVGLLVWAGSFLLLSNLRRLSRPSLSDRLRPYHPGAPSSPRALDPTAPLRALVGPLVEIAGSRLASLFGIAEDAGTRLRRIHSSLSAPEFRARQLGWCIAGLAAALLSVVALSLPVAVAGLMVVGFPLLVFLVLEQRLAGASARWQADVVHELPVVAEQLAMLLAAGYSQGAALNRVAERSRGCCARDLRVVTNRVRQGVGGATALREWATSVNVPAVDRLVAVLVLNTEASDLGRLVAAEARQCRKDLQRKTAELIHRRGEQVWVPVTVATLVPGVILIAVPFLSALHAFSGS